ncbi:hypothetical protein BHE74_00029184 [Ensete ventricosum]|nr:hypothetical protein BHE74_00029184 [Ensete ventricosum]
MQLSSKVPTGNAGGVVVVVVVRGHTWLGSGGTSDTSNILELIIPQVLIPYIYVAALVPKSELDGEMGDSHVALQARLMSQALRKLSHSLSRSQTILLFINQTLGTQVTVNIVKNKHAPPFRTSQFELEFGKGISSESEIIDLGCKHELVTTRGSFYSYEERKFHGKDAFKRYLADNQAIREELIAKLREKLLDSRTDKNTVPEGDIPAGNTSEETIASDTTDDDIVAEA